MYIIEMRNITKEFPGIIANDDVTLQLKKGEIHALLGENGAGKSTLMSVLFGLYQQEKGSIYKNNEEVIISNPGDANLLGIGMVHQHFKLVHNFTVLENIVLGVETTNNGVLKMKEAREKVQSLSEKYGFDIDIDKEVGDISVGMQQRVEILKMLYRDNEILIFDEPTAVLTPQEIESLMNTMQNMAKEGKSILFITHKLDEIKQVADRCTVLRKGKLIGTVDVAETSKEEMSEMMVGRKVSLMIEKEDANIGETVLRVSGLNQKGEKWKNLLTDISFKARAGEILCIAGIEGNGQTDLVYALTGLANVDSGSVRIKAYDMNENEKKTFEALQSLFDNLVANYGNAIYSFCYELTGSPKKANSLFEKAFFNSLEEIHKSNDIDSAQSVLFKTASSIWKDSKLRNIDIEANVEVDTEIEGETGVEVAAGIEVEANTGVEVESESEIDVETMIENRLSEVRELIENQLEYSNTPAPELIQEIRADIMTRDITKSKIRKRSELGIAHIPEDRHKHGLVLDYTLAYNAILQTYFEKDFQKRGFLNIGAINEYAKKLIERFDIRSSEGEKTVTRSMSGGNQQKVILAREIDRDPKVLIAVQPTRGLDVGAIEYIHKELVRQRDEGKAVLLVSLELDEVMNVSDRILVMYEGEIVADVNPEEVTFQELGLYMSGAKRDDVEVVES